MGSWNLCPRPCPCSQGSDHLKPKGGRRGFFRLRLLKMSTISMARTHYRFDVLCCTVFLDRCFSSNPVFPFYVCGARCPRGSGNVGTKHRWSPLPHTCWPSYWHFLPQQILLALRLKSVFRGHGLTALWGQQHQSRNISWLCHSWKCS